MADGAAGDGEAVLTKESTPSTTSSLDKEDACERFKRFFQMWREPSFDSDSIPKEAQEVLDRHTIEVCKGLHDEASDVIIKGTENVLLFGVQSMKHSGGEEWLGKVLEMFSAMMDEDFFYGCEDLLVPGCMKTVRMVIGTEGIGEGLLERAIRAFRKILEHSPEARQESGEEGVLEVCRAVEGKLGVSGVRSEVLEMCQWVRERKVFPASRHASLLLFLALFSLFSQVLVLPPSPVLLDSSVHLFSALFYLVNKNRVRVWAGEDDGAFRVGDVGVGEVGKAEVENLLRGLGRVVGAECSYATKLPCVKLLSVFTAGSEAQTWAALHCGLLESLYPILRTPIRDPIVPPTLLKEVGFTISNVAAGTLEQIESLVRFEDRELWKRVVEWTEVEDERVAAEFRWTVANACASVDRSVLLFDSLLWACAPQVLTKAICTSDRPPVVHVSLDALHHLLEHAPETDKAHPLPGDSRLAFILHSIESTPHSSLQEALRTWKDHHMAQTVQELWDKAKQAHQAIMGEEGAEGGEVGGDEGVGEGGVGEGGEEEGGVGEEEEDVEELL